MMQAFMLFKEDGTLVYSAQFEKVQLQVDLLAGFVSAVNQFGLEIFPGEDLEDIIFTKHHICLEKHKSGSITLLFMYIHSPDMQHLLLRKISTELFIELKGKHAAHLQDPVIDQAKFDSLDGVLERILINERRPERILPR